MNLMRLFLPALQSSDDESCGGAQKLPSALDAAVADVSSSDGEGSSPKCPICLLKLKESGEIGVPDGGCNHEFCLECIKEWAKNVPTCPLAGGAGRAEGDERHLPAERSERGRHDVRPDEVSQARAGRRQAGGEAPAVAAEELRRRRQRVKVDLSGMRRVSPAVPPPQMCM